MSAHWPRDRYVELNGTDAKLKKFRKATSSGHRTFASEQTGDTSGVVWLTSNCF